MLPFLVGELTVTKPDGTTVHIGNNSSDASSDEQAGDGSSAKSAQSVATSKRHHSDSGDDAGTVVPIVAIVFVFLWLIIKALMAPFTQKAGRRGQNAAGGSSAALSDEEQAVLLKLQRTLADMESRIESLETILIDEHRTKEKYGNKI